MRWLAMSGAPSLFYTDKLLNFALGGRGNIVAGNVKPLLAVIILAIPAFLLARQLCAPFISPREFSVWRNVWFAATAAEFLSGYFLIFIVAMSLICTYAYAQRAVTPALFFILLLAVPLIDIPLAGFGGINYLFSISNGRVLSIALLAPLLFAARGRNRKFVRSYTAPDLLVVSYVLLQVALQFRNSDITNVSSHGLCAHIRHFDPVPRLQSN